MSYRELNKRYLKLREKYNSLLAGLSCIPSVSNIESCIKEQHCTADIKPMRYIEDNNMNIETTKDYASERRYLCDFVWEAKNRKVKELRKHFNIDCVDTYELSPEEYVKAIQDGKFKYRDEGKHSKVPQYYGHPMNGICLCDPDKEPDHTSYQKVLKMLEKDEEAIMLKVRVLEPEKALPLVEKFEERKYH